MQRSEFPLRIRSRLLRSLLLDSVREPLPLLVATLSANGRCSTTHGLGIEFDALYRRVGFNRLTKSSGVVLDATHTTANSWEFPILAKVVVRRIPFVKAFIDGGVAFRTLSGVSSTTVRSLFDSMTRSSGTSDPILTNRSSYGAVVGLGAEMRVGPFRCLPEMRYIRWAADRNLDLQLHSNQNQLDFILGIAF